MLIFYYILIFSLILNVSIFSYLLSINSSQLSQFKLDFFKDFKITLIILFLFNSIRLILIYLELINDIKFNLQNIIIILFSSISYVILVKLLSFLLYNYFIVKKELFLNIFFKFRYTLYYNKNEPTKNYGILNELFNKGSENLTKIMTGNKEMKVLASNTLKITKKYSYVATIGASGISIIYVFIKYHFDTINHESQIRTEEHIKETKESQVRMEEHTKEYLKILANKKDTDVHNIEHFKENIEDLS